ncbi:MAG: inositol monophosphatase family protein [Desulfohalobiaceae bacterium]
MRDILQKTSQCILEAGRIILEHWEQQGQIRHKGRIDLVTDTDLAVEEHLKASLASILPEARFLAEESAPTQDPGSLCWILDPLDGTTNFAHRLPAVAISVALYQEGQIRMGLIYLPKTGELFYAQQGQGAFLNQERISVSQEHDIEKALIATGFPYDIRERLQEIMPRLGRVLAKSQGVRRMGSAAVDLAYTACGRLDGFFEQGLKPWDTAAGQLLVQEAGGQVSRFEPQLELGLRSPDILASNGLIHTELSTLLLEKDKNTWQSNC